MRFSPQGKKIQANPYKVDDVLLFEGTENYMKKSHGITVDYFIKGDGNMKTMKKLFVLLATLLLCMGMSVVSASAATMTEDGVEVTLTTDGDVYEEGDDITATLTVTNTNDFAVTNVSLEHILLEGYELAEGSQLTKALETLEAGATEELVVTYVAEEEEVLDTESGAETGDANAALWMGVMLVAAGGVAVLAVKGRKSRKILLPLMFIGLLGAGLLPAQAAMAQEINDWTVNVSEEIQVGEEVCTIEAVVKYTVALPEEEVVITGVEGTVCDAVTGEILPGTMVTLRAGADMTAGDAALTTAGEAAVVMTDANGYYTMEMPAGTYTAEYSLEGYITGYANVVCADGFVLQNAALSPVMESDEYRVVLTWGDTPRDLDSHLTGPLADGSRYHVYYSNKTARSEGEIVATLDRDDTTSYGPETITITVANDGVYKYSIHDYTNRGSVGSTELSMSQAKVDLYKGESLIATYTVPENVVGTVWNVFEIEGDTVRTLNTFENINSPSNVGALAE